MHPREHFRESLERLHSELADLGRNAHQALTGAVTALHTGDAALGARIVTDDHLIDEGHEALNRHILSLLATQQPVARDLRTLIGSMGIASEIERSADYTRAITRPLTVPPPHRPLPPIIDTLAEAALATFAHAIEVVERFDGEGAHAVGEDDERVDALRTQAKAQLIEGLQHDPEAAPWLAELLAAVTMLERVADRATNIAEWVCYIVSNKQLDLNPDHEG